MEKAGNIAWFDAHVHLQDERLLPSLDAVMQRARAAGIARFICCGACEGDWADVDAVCRRFPDVTPSFGLHPWYVKEAAGTEWARRLGDRLAAYPGAGVGEIGLDHAIPNRDDREQESAFVSQLELAARLQRPVSIHCRKAWEPMVHLMTAYGPGLRGFVMHSYSGSAELVAPLAALGAYFSFSGAITFHNNRRGHKALAAVPADRLLIETDSPDLMPYVKDRPERGEKPVNEPANLRIVAEAVAALLKMSVADLATLTTANAERLFGGAP